MWCDCMSSVVGWPIKMCLHGSVFLWNSIFMNFFLSCKMRVMYQMATAQQPPRRSIRAVKPSHNSKLCGLLHSVTFSPKSLNFSGKVRLLDWVIRQLYLKEPHGGVPVRGRCPSLWFARQTQIKASEAWQLPCWAHVTQLAKLSLVRQNENILDSISQDGSIYLINPFLLSPSSWDLLGLNLMICQGATQRPNVMLVSCIYTILAGLNYADRRVCFTYLPAVIFQKDNQIMSTNCFSSAGALSLYYSVGSKVHQLEDTQGGRQMWKESVLEKVILIDNQVPCGLCCGLLIPQSMFCCRIHTAAWRPWTTQTGRERQWNQWLSHKRALVSSSQSSKVALLAPLFAPTSTGKKHAWFITGPSASESVLFSAFSVLK